MVGVKFTLRIYFYSTRPLSGLESGLNIRVRVINGLSGLANPLLEVGQIRSEAV